MSRAELSDQAIVEQVRSGSPELFGVLVERYQKPLFNVAYRITNDHHDAEDVTQAAFLKAYENLPSFDTRFRFFSWIYRITVNEALNLDAKRKRSEGFADGDAQTVADPDDLLDRHATEQQVEEAVLWLKPTDRAIVLLRHFQGFSYEEIGFVMDLPEKTVKSRLYTARQRLRSIMVRQDIQN